MTYPTVAVTVALSQLGGTIPDGTIVTATLDKDDRYQGFLVASSVSGSTVGGSVVLQCFPNALSPTGLGTTGSVYTFSAYIPGLSLWGVTAQIPNNACNLSDVASLGVLPSASDLALFTATKDASNGFPGLTLFKLNLKNALGTITSFFTTAATVARTWTMPDKSGTVAMTSDVLTDHTALTSIGTNTHAQIDTALTRLANTSNTNTGNETGASIAALTHAAALKSAIVDVDEVTGGDSAAAFGLIRTTWASVAAYLKAKTDLLYLAIGPLYREDANTIAQRNGATAQEHRWYWSYTDAANYTRLAARSSGYGATLSAEAAGTGAAQWLNLQSSSSLQIISGATIYLQSGAASVWRVEAYKIRPSTDNAYAIGDPTYRCSGVYTWLTDTKSLATATVLKTASYTVALTDSRIEGDATAGAVVLTLPALSTVTAGQEFAAIKIDASANAVTLDGNGSETINGGLTLSTTTQWGLLRVKANAAKTAWLTY